MIVPGYATDSGRGIGHFKTASVRDVTPNFLKMLLKWNSAVRTVMPSSAAISSLLFPRNNKPHTSFSRKLIPYSFPKFSFLLPGVMRRRAASPTSMIVGIL